MSSSRRSFLRRTALAAVASAGEPLLTAEEPARTVAAVKSISGVPTLFINGQPHGPMFYTPGGRDEWERAEMAKRGFSVFFEMVHDVGWPGEQDAVFQHLDTVMARVLAEAPDALVILRFYVCNQRRLALDYPDEIMAFNDGATGHFTKWYHMEGVPEAQRGYSSFASLVWREKTAEALTNYVAHIRAAPYARRIIGFFIGGGGTEEWYYYENFDETKYCLDFSPAMKTAFRRHLREKYGGDTARLRAAWNDASADFATAEPPDVSSRLTTDGGGVFWNPAQSQRVRDYFYVHNKVMEDAILHFAKTLKAACQREQIVGLFYGSLMNQWLVKGGQATFKDLLRSPDIDFISAPPQYGRRGPGEHAALRFLNASVKQRGKIWINESDIRTVFSREDPADPMRNGRALNLPDSVACLQREFAQLLCEGANGWWLQPESNDYQNPEILSLFQQMQRLGHAALRYDRGSDTDIAAVVHQDSLMAGPSFSSDTSHHLVLPSLLEGFRVQETCRIGAPVDYYELEDILTPGAKSYKLYLMLNCFSLTEDERRRIQLLRRNGACFVWMYAPGILQPGREPELSPTHIHDLLGFELERRIGVKLSPNMKLTKAGVTRFPGFDPERVFGSFERPQWRKNPQTGVMQQIRPGGTVLRELCAGRAGGEVLARYQDGGQPSILMRETPEATDYWIGSVMAPADLLRAIAQRAGCHLFCAADEIIYANKSFLAIHTATAGERTFHLRRPGDVIELSSNRQIARNTTTFRDEIPPFSTRTYFISRAPSGAI